MAYDVEIENRASRTLVRLARSGDLATLGKINATIADLADEPRPANATKMVGMTDVWRIRVGDYLIVYAVDDTIRLVWVTKVGHRRDVYER